MSKVEALSAAVPPGVAVVCSRLSEAGFEAYTVGGAVRDTLLGRAAGDWDVTTSAHPEEVEQLFRKVLPTGIEHGTVTVLVGKGNAREAIEVTTFRGEGGYTDGRRPDHVTFGVPLDEDLARRDFVINAIAFDPVARSVRDPFGGAQDLEQRVIRAVGEPERRFAEDGLRIMRAVRFAATLEFEIEADTAAAIPGALPSLEKVSRERVHDELFKLLRAPRPSLGLSVALTSGIIDSVFPELQNRERGAWESLFKRVDDTRGDPAVRGALILSSIDPMDSSEAGDLAAAQVADGICRRLKWSNADRKRARRMIRYGRPGPWLAGAGSELRRRLAGVEREGSADLLAFMGAYADARSDVAELVTKLQEILDSGAPLAIGELAVAGRDLIRELGLQPGKSLGVVLRRLLDEALERPELNQREMLLARARELGNESNEAG